MIDIDDDKRRISVNGYAEMEVEPDEIIYSLTIKEYWEEEFQPGKKYEDYQTKVSIVSIESRIIAQLYTAGVSKEDIKVSSMGNYHRQSGKEALVSKSLELSIKSFDVIDAIGKTVDSRGVSNMHIQELKHKDMEKFKMEMRIKALLNAREKADSMLKALGEKCDKVIYIDEANRSSGGPIPIRENLAKVRAMSDGGGSNSPQTLKKINVSSRVYAIFSIAN